MALHPLALDDQVGEENPMPGDLVRTLMNVVTDGEVRSDGTAALRSPLPDEVQFESPATRVRTFILKRDRLYWPNAFDALDRLTGLEGTALRLSSGTYGKSGREPPTALGSSYIRSQRFTDHAPA